MLHKNKHKLSECIMPWMSTMSALSNILYLFHYFTIPHKHAISE